MYLQWHPAQIKKKQPPLYLTFNLEKNLIRIILHYILMSLRRPQHDCYRNRSDLLLNSQKIYWKVWHLLTSTQGIMEREFLKFWFLTKWEKFWITKTLNLFLSFSPSQTSQSSPIIEERKEVTGDSLH